MRPPMRTQGSPSSSPVTLRTRRQRCAAVRVTLDPTLLAASEVLDEPAIGRLAQILAAGLPPK